MTYGYLRVSTVEQDNNKFQGEILLYSNKNHLGHVSFVEEKVTGVKDWKQRELGTLIKCHFKRCKNEFCMLFRSRENTVLDRK